MTLFIPSFRGYFQKFSFIAVVFFSFFGCIENGPSLQDLKSQKEFAYIDKETKDTSRFYAYTDLDTALCYAKKEKKDILLIFSCYACMSEGDREWKTLSLYGDNNRIQQLFVIAWLPVDEKRPAADTNRVVFWYGKDRRLVEAGDVYKYFEEKAFGYSTQPLFCFIDTLKRPFGGKIGYTKNKKDIEKFIQSGIRVR